MDFALAKYNMIQSQLRTWDILDQKVLDTFSLLNREDFVPAKFKDLAYADVEIPIGGGQIMLTPKLGGRMVQELEIQKDDLVLQIGTGTGFITALISFLAKKVISSEIDPELHKIARISLEKYSRHNIMLLQEDGLSDRNETTLFDKIILTGSLPVIPEILKSKLSTGGRMIGVFGQNPIMSVVLLVKGPQSELIESKVFETCIPSLLQKNFVPGFDF